MKIIPKFCPVCDKELKYNSIPPIPLFELLCSDSNHYIATVKRARIYVNGCREKDHVVAESYHNKNNGKLYLFYKYNSSTELSEMYAAEMRGSDFRDGGRQKIDINMLEDFNPKDFESFIKIIEDNISFA